MDIELYNRKKALLAKLGITLPASPQRAKTAEDYLKLADAMDKDSASLAMDWRIPHLNVTDEVLEFFGFGSADAQGRRFFPLGSSSPEGFEVALYWNIKMHRMFYIVQCNLNRYAGNPNREEAKKLQDQDNLTEYKLKIQMNKRYDRVVLAFILRQCDLTGETPRLVSDVKAKDISITYARRADGGKKNVYVIKHPALNSAFIYRLQDRHLANGYMGYNYWNAELPGVDGMHSRKTGEIYVKVSGPLSTEQIAQLKLHLVTLSEQSVEPAGPYKVNHRKELKKANDKRKAEKAAAEAQNAKEYETAIEEHSGKTVEDMSSLRIRSNSPGEQKALKELIDKARQAQQKPNPAQV